MFRFYILFVVGIVVMVPLGNAQTINLKTEHYPPYNYDLQLVKEGVGVGGAATEIVLEMMRRSEFPYTLDLVSWKRAYSSAKDGTYVGVYSIVRTEEREKLFKWVGPIAENNYVMLADSGKNITINNEEELKNYTVGVYRGAAGEGFAKALGLPMESVRSDHLNVLKLHRGRIDLWMAGHLYAPYLVRQLSKTHEQLGGLKLSPVYTLQSTKMYLGFGLSTPDGVIQKLQSILDEMEKEGFVKSVYEKYQP